MREKGDIIGGTWVDGEILGGVKVKRVRKKGGMVILELDPKYTGPVEPGSKAVIDTLKAIVVERKNAKAAWREQRGFAPEAKSGEPEIIDEHSSQNGDSDSETEAPDF